MEFTLSAAAELALQAFLSGLLHTQPQLVLKLITVALLLQTAFIVL